MSDSVAIIGGTGNLGFGLALRWAVAGAKVLIGSRDPSRADRAAARIAELVADARVGGRANAEAVRQARMVVLSVPLAAQIETLKGIRSGFAPGTVLVDSTVPLERAVGGRLSAALNLWEGSAAQRAARYAGGAQVAAAFHTLSASSLSQLEQPVESDVLIVGDQREARALVAEWVRKIPGARPIDAGPLENARYAEHLAALLVSLNLRHKVPSSGIRFTGLPEPN